MGYEDYTGYTEVDPNSRFTVATNHIDVAGLTSNEDAYIYADKGAGHFGDVEHLVDIQLLSSSDQYCWMCPWAITNNVDDFSGWTAGLWVLLYEFSNNLRIYAGEIGGSNLYITTTENVYKYLTIERSGTSFQVKVYSDAARTDLLDTVGPLTVATTTYRYVYAVSSRNTGSNLIADGDVQNLDLQEVVAGQPYISRVQRVAGMRSWGGIRAFSKRFPTFKPGVVA